MGMTVMLVQVSLIDPPSPVLRRFSETEVMFLELVEQIKAHGGSFQAPPARPRPGGRFQIIDGHRRYRATICAGLDSMALNVLDLDDEKYLAAQIACNSMHKVTDRIDLALHLDKLRRASDEEISLGDLALICERSKSWVSKTLNLNHLHPQFKQAVKRDEVSIGNAHWVARLPLPEQWQYLDDAKTMPTRDFEKKLQQALRDYQEQIKQGKLSKLGIDGMKPNMRNLKIIEEEMGKPSQLPLMIASAGITNPVDAAVLALKWAFRVDPVTIEERKEKMLVHERQRLNDTSLRRQERDLMKSQSGT